jgi:aldehyde:ferredoxin oxidoreductase
MARGYMGKILNVDLSSGRMHDEETPESACRNFLGGYGLGARILYDRMPAGVDPLGPENILGFFTGPLTGTPAIEGNRFVVVCKSPLTGTWGDANCGGDFGPHLKFAGYDAIVFTGVSEKPVYLVIDNGVATLRDAASLWGKDTNETEDQIKDLLERAGGQKYSVASIGQAGEKLSLIAAIMNDKGRAAGRSGVGAVMGSKKLKAIAVRGSQEVPLFDAPRTRELRGMYAKRSEGFYDFLKTYGTIGGTADSALSGDSPVKNWGGVGMVDFPSAAEKFEADTLMAYRDRKYGCWHCTMACGGYMSVKGGRYKGLSHHKVEYETASAFGSMTLVDDFPVIMKLNEMCNRYGFDSISAGATTAFAVECFEEGILTTEDTGGLELRWGSGEALIALLEKMALREGIGDVLADGVRKAAERIGKGSAAYAIHVGGQEIPMHDPKLQPGLATAYVMDATPGRHTQGQEQLLPVLASLTQEAEGLDKYVYTGKGELHRKVAALVHVEQASGLCMLAPLCYDFSYIPDFLTAVTGWDIDLAECYQIGERIADIRHAFNIREGVNPLQFGIPGRLIGSPPQTTGPLRGVTVDVDTMVREYCQAMDWDPETAVPSRERLVSLGLDDVARDLHG